MKYFTDLVENKSLISEECDCRVYLWKKNTQKLQKKIHQVPENSGIERH